MGVTAIKLGHYAIGGLGMFPWIVVLVFIGTTLSNIHDAVNGNLKTGPLHLVSVCVGALLALTLICYVSHVVKRHLKEMLTVESNCHEVDQPQQETSRPCLGDRV